MGLYLICTSARTGGNVLCSTLTQTGMLGKPGSYLCAYPANKVLIKLSRDDFEKYLENVPERLYQEKNNTINRSSDLAWLHETNLLQNLDGPIERLRFFYEHLKASNMLEYLKNIHNFLQEGDNWGIKVLAHDSNGIGFDFFLHQLKEGQPNNNKKSTKQLLQEIGDIKYIWLTRRNKVRQGLSRWKAHHTNKWHQKQKIVAQQKIDTDLPSMEVLNKYVLQLTLDDAYWEEFFTENQITPLTLVYEDFIRNPEQTTRDILKHVGINPNKDAYFNGFSEFKMANGQSKDFINTYYSNANIW